MKKEEFNQQLLDAEKKCNLFEVEILGKRLWKFLRMTSFVFLYDYNAQYFESKNLVKLKKTNLFEVLKKRWKNPSSDIFFKDLPLILNKTDILYFIGYTPKIENGQSINSYLGDYILSTPNDISYSLFEWSHTENEVRHLNPKIKNTYYVSHELIRLLNKSRENVSEKAVYNELNEFIFSPIEKVTEINFTEKVKEKVVYETLFHILHGEAYYKFYRYILNKIKPKLVLFFNADEPYNQILMDVCAEKNIKIAEIEHGISWEYLNDIKFCSNVDKNIIYPFYYVAYGDFLRKCYSKEDLNCKFGLSSQNIKSIGRILLNNRADIVKNKINIQNKGKRYLIISPEESTELLKFTIQLSDLLKSPDNKIICKLRPGNIYNTKICILEEDNNIIIKHTTPIYDLIIWADYVIGTESTVLYESVKFGKPTFIYGEISKNHPLVKINAAIGILSVDEFLKKIQDLPKLNINYEAINYFYANNAKENYQNFLREVVYESNGSEILK